MLTALYIIAGVCGWIAIGVITFRILHHFSKNDEGWNNPNAYQVGREGHAKMGFWLGPVYTLALALSITLSLIIEFGKWMNERDFYRKLMGLK